MTGTSVNGPAAAAGRRRRAAVTSATPAVPDPPAAKKSPKAAAKKQRRSPRTPSVAVPEDESDIIEATAAVPSKQEEITSVQQCGDAAATSSSPVRGKAKTTAATKRKAQVAVKKAKSAAKEPILEEADKDAVSVKDEQAPEPQQVVETPETMNVDSENALIAQHSGEEKSSEPQKEPDEVEMPVLPEQPEIESVPLKPVTVEKPTVSNEEMNENSKEDTCVTAVQGTEAASNVAPDTDASELPQTPAPISESGQIEADESPAQSTSKKRRRSSSKVEEDLPMKVPMKVASNEEPSEKDLLDEDAVAIASNDPPATIPIKDASTDEPPAKDPLDEAAAAIASTNPPAKILEILNSTVGARQLWESVQQWSKRQLFLKNLFWVSHNAHLICAKMAATAIKRQHSAVFMLLVHCVYCRTC
eukprot:GHVT01039423.1.p1 GENE.GHVT01039423.1~~GHVT01039423.1.p1  ORF type:complete len:418 (-),score=80.05 GHVT01039423.1:727-1980(-)